MSVAAEREHNERDEGAQVSRWKSREPARRRTSMRQYASSPRKDKSGYERLQGIAEGASSAPRLASSSAASFPGRNKCPWTHCSLIEQESEDSSCQICHRVSRKRKDGGEDRVTKTERESDRRREVAGLLVLSRPAKSMHNGIGFSGKT